MHLHQCNNIRNHLLYVNPIDLFIEYISMFIYPPLWVVVFVGGIMLYGPLVRQVHISISPL